MIRVCKFTVLGPPVGKQRAAPIVERGKLIGKVTPKKTRDYERTIRTMANLSLPNTWPKDARYALYVNFRSDPSARGKPPDIDNVWKAVADALKGIAWRDDTQVDDGGQSRLWEGEPRTEVRIATLDYPCDYCNIESARCASYRPENKCCPDCKHGGPK